MTYRARSWAAGPALAAAFAFVSSVPFAQAQTPQGTAFTYQGRLTDGGTPATGTYDFQFLLFGAGTGGSQVGPMVTRDEVVVDQGFLTVTLDFGAVFAGNKRFLQIGARPGPSTGAYTILSPRQELTPGPATLFSASVPWTGVSGKPAGFADNTDNDSGGTVTSVGAGAGLTGGPITIAGTLAVATGGIATDMLADGAVTSPKIASGAVGLAQINQAQVQARVGGTCPSGRYLRGINPDGSVVCEPVFAPNSIKTVDDPANLVGLHTSITNDADGLPVISYYDDTADALKIAKCGNLACTAGNVLRFVDDTASNVGQYSSIALGTDGLPVISYWDATAGALKVARCSNAFCSVQTRTTVDDPPVNSVGSHSSIAIGADGLPIVSYHDATAQALKVVKCGNAACTNANTITTLDDSASNVGQHTSIAIGAGGLPTVSYYDATAGALKVARCGNAACSTGNVLTTVDDSAVAGIFSGLQTSLALGSDGLPVIAYAEQQFTSLSLKVVRCDSAPCNGTNTITTIAFGNAQDPSIAIGSDGLPVISYYSPDTCGLHVAKCGNAACSTGNVLTTVDGPSGPACDFAGQYSSIVIGSDGLPVISYSHFISPTDVALKVAKCSTGSCR